MELNVSTTTSVYTIHQAAQQKRLFEEQQKCENTIYNYTAPDNGTYCEPVWDMVMCWNAAQAGTTVKQRCPDYINGLWKKGHAFRTCTPNGTWYFNPQTNSTWTDYTACFPENLLSKMEEHLPRIQLITNIGYGISLCSLVVAVFIMLCCRKLHSRSNTLHINLFIAFIMRAFMSFLKSSLFVKGLGLKKDVINLPSGDVQFKNDGTHWECKLLYSVFMYSLAASSMWIFMEALYLYMLVYKTMFTERHGVTMYMVIGWLGPLTFLIPWIIVRILLEDLICWNTNPTPEYLWIIRGPLLYTTVINFIFFIDIVRVLFIRVHKNKRVTGARKIRKLAKFIVVLIPLFGVLYIVFNLLSSNDLDVERDIPYLYCEMFYNSFQGFILAVLFCFLNEEVHMELKKFWYKYALRRKDSYVYTRTALMTSYRPGSHNSRHHSLNEQSSVVCYANRNVGNTKNNNDSLLKNHLKNGMKNANKGRKNSYESNCSESSFVTRDTCADTNCKFLTIPDKKRRNDLEMK